MPLLGVQAFANTIDVEEGTDRLADVDSGLHWLRGVKLVAPSFELNSDGVRDTQALRETLRGLLAANTAGKPEPGAIARLRRQAGGSRVRVRADEAGGLALDLHPAGTIGELGSQLLAIVFQAQIDGTWERLKLCENSECRWAFYDSSRNRSGHWCRMGECGNRLKNRAYRARRSARRSAA